MINPGGQVAAACFILFLCLMPGAGIRAESDLGSLASLAQAYPEAPLPLGWVAGIAGLNVGNRYAVESSQSYLIPGAIYMGDQWAFLGDRARYYFYKQGPIAGFAYGRLRLGNLDPDEHAEWQTLEPRRTELEAGIGADLVTPFALLTSRISSDVTGRSKGQEALLWADFPVLKDRLLVMPGVGLVWRSRNLASYYFGGISDTESTPDLQTYDTGHTLSLSGALITSYRLDPKWLAMLLVGYEVYDQSISDSPLVQGQGEHFLLVGAGYQF